MAVDATVSIAALKAKQTRLGLTHVHLVHLGETEFTIAHTDEERAAGAPLEDCDLHRWLHSLDGPPADIGLWVAVPHVPDGRQEPYGSPPWDLDPVELHAPADGAKQNAENLELGNENQIAAPRQEEETDA